MRIAVLGLWHLGAVAAACWPRRGHIVTAWDPDGQVRAAVAAARPLVAEPGLPERIAEALVAGTLTVADTCAAAVRHVDVTHLAFDAAVDESGEPADGRLDPAVDVFAEHAPDGALLLVSSQVRIGTCGRWRKVLRARGRGLRLAYYPENLRLGSAVERFDSAEGAVLGSDEDALESALALVGTLGTAPIVMGVESAEMVKHARNSYLALCIVFANELAWLTLAVGADAREVVRGLRADPRVSPAAPLRPGPAFSGATLRRDVRALADLGARHGRPELFSTLLAANDRHEDTVRSWLAEEYGPDLTGRAFAVLGLTYKAGTSTLRDSLPLRLCADLLAGGATVRAYDPLADEVPALGRRFTRVGDPADAVRDADAVLMLTAFQDLPWAGFAPARRLVLDDTAVLDPAELTEAGWTVRSLLAGGGA